MSEAGGENNPKNFQHRNSGRQEAGLYTVQDSVDYSARYLLPVLNRSLSARTPSHPRAKARGEFNRSVTKFDHNSDYFTEFRARGCDYGDGVPSFELSIDRYETMDDLKMLVEWPVVEASGLGQALKERQFVHALGVDEDEVFDCDDELTWFDDRLSMQASIDAIEEGEDVETLVELIHGYHVYAFCKRALVLVNGMKPELLVENGYMFNDEHYYLDDKLFYETKSDSMDDLVAFANLKEQTRYSIDGEVLQEFHEALQVLGMIKLSRDKQGEN